MAFHLPEDMKWKCVHRKSESFSDSSIRGNSTLLTFSSSLTGVSSVQIAVIRDKPASKIGKHVAVAFEGAIALAADQSADEVFM